MSSERENFEYQQEYFRRGQAYEALGSAKDRLKAIWRLLEDLDDTQVALWPEDVADLKQQLDKINFIKSAIHHGEVSGNAGQFAHREMNARETIIEETLNYFADTRGNEWETRRDLVTELWQLQAKIPSLEETAGNIDMRLRSLKLKSSQNYSAKQIAEDTNEIDEAWADAQFSDEEVWMLDRETWDYERQWYDISAEAAERSQVEMQKTINGLEKDKKEYAQRMDQALKHEREAHKLTKEIEKELMLLKDLRNDFNQIQKRQLANENESLATAVKYNNEIDTLQSYFDDIIPASVWPDYIMREPHEAHDPAAAEAFQESLDGTMDFHEQREFHEKQIRLAYLLDERTKLVQIIGRDKRNFEGETRDKKQYIKQVTNQIKAKKKDLELLIGKRSAELKTALALPKIEGYEYLDEVEDATVKVEGVEAKGEVAPAGKIVEASAKITVSTSASAKAEVIKYIQENDESLDAIDDELKKTPEEKALDKERKRANAIQDALNAEMDQKAKIPWRKGLAEEVANDDEANDNKTKEYRAARDVLNRLMDMGELLNKPYKVKLDQRKHERHGLEMLALRCGVNGNNKKEIDIEVIGRVDAAGNQILCFFPATNTTGIIAIRIYQRTGDWYLKTAESQYDDWVEFENNTPDVPPSLKMQRNVPLYTLVKFHNDILKHLKKEYAARKTAQSVAVPIVDEVVSFATGGQIP